ncbi:MAG: hypothetical protein ACLRX7_07610 [Acutalibacteraceae bacterium]
MVGECFGYGVDFEYRPYSTVVRSAGANDVLGDQDDILTEYQFDTFGRTTTTIHIVWMVLKITEHRNTVIQAIQQQTVKITIS